MVGVERFELPTLWSQTRCATRLRYTPIHLKRGWDYTLHPAAATVKCMLSPNDLPHPLSACIAFGRIDNGPMLSSSEYLISSDGRYPNLDAWADGLGDGYRLLCLNRFADAFFADASGAVFMLDIAVGTLCQIANSADEFSERLEDDEDGWLLRPLVDHCRSEGKILGDQQCYAFTTLRCLAVPMPQTISGSVRRRSGSM